MSTPARAPADLPGTPTSVGRHRVSHRDRRPEIVALAVAAVGIVAAFTVEALGIWDDVHAWLPPLSAYFEPTLLSPGLPMSVAVAWAVISSGPAIAERLGWRRLLLASTAAGLAWSVSLALIRGWSGIADPLLNEHEYLVDVPRVDDLTQVIPEFTDRIDSSPQTNWVTHVAAHPPLTFLCFLWLDRVGLGGPVWGAVIITLLSATTVPAVLVTLRRLGDEARARAAAPYLVLTPLMIWSVVSADGVFAAAAAWGLALLASAAVARGWRSIALSVAAGVVLGLAVNLSYGLMLAGTLSLAVLAAARSWRPLAPAALAALAVVGVFAALGFWWLAGQQELVNRYYRGIASERPQSYWIWANLAVVCFCVGPAVVAAIGRWVQQLRRPDDATTAGGSGLLGRPAAWWLAVGAAAAILAADLSGLSRSEVERIWLPFMVWLVPLAAWLDTGDRRRWLIAQAGWAIAISCVLRFTW